MEGIGGAIRRRTEQAKKNTGRKPDHLPGIETPEIIKKEQHIHSEAHALAAEISAHFGDRKKFAAYLSVILKMGVPQARTVFSSIRSGDANVDNPRKFFMWLSRSEITKPKRRSIRRTPKNGQLDMKRFLR